MEPTNQKNETGQQRSSAQIIKILEDFKKSDGITVKQYCAMAGIKDAAFYRWRKMYGIKKPKKQKAAGFFKVVRSERSAPTITANTLFAEVKGIRIYQPVAAEFLKVLAL